MSTIKTLDDLRGLQPEGLVRAVAEMDIELTDLHQTSTGELRDLSEDEENRLDDLIRIRKRAQLQLEKHGKLRSQFESGRGVVTPSGSSLQRGGQDPDYASRSPLAYSPESLDAVQAALDERTTGRFQAFGIEERAALTTSTFGSPRAWGANVLAGPRILHVVAGVPRQPTNAVLAQVPNFTLPTAQAGAAENASLAEFAASTAGSVTLARFGRYTDLSRESNIGTDAAGLVGLQGIGIARDLDTVLVNAVETAAGSAVAFSADVPAAIRKAMAQVIDNTASASAADLVVLTHPDNAALLQDVAPIGGETMGEGFQRFSGALVYPCSAVDTGFMTIAALRAGVRYFEAWPTVTETQVASIKTATLTIATSTISGYGLILAGGATGFAIKVDVVTP